MSSEDESGFVARWARRKQEARQSNPEPEAEAAPDPKAAVVPDAPPEARSEAEILEALGLPDPDTLGQGADFRAFMAAGVPSAIRNRALRALWRSDPRLANLDGLVDHGEDFSDHAMVKAGMKTAYQVGRGFLRQMAKEGETEPDSAPPGPTEATPVDQVKAEQVADDAADGEADESTAATEPAAETPPARPRRMRFDLPDSTTLVENTSGGRE